MNAKTKIEKAIDYIAKMGTARGPEISEASGIPAERVSAQLYQYVKAGVLVSCKVTRPGMQSINEYRLGGHIPGDAWRDFKVNVHSAHEQKRAESQQKKPTTHRPPTQADHPQVSDKNSGSTSADSPLVATGRAVTEAKPHRKAPQNASGVGGNVTNPDPDQTRFGYWSDGNLSIMQGDMSMVLPAADAHRLAIFVLSCLNACACEVTR